MKHTVHTMNPDDKVTPGDTPDSLDAMLAAHPLRPSADFTARTLARLDRMRAEGDPEVDRLLTGHPVAAPVGFADRVMAAVAAERRKKFILFRVFAPAALAACLALAALPSVHTGHRTDSAEARLAAVVETDAELRALAALPETAATSKASSDIATFADIDAALTANNTEYAYGI